MAETKTGQCLCGQVRYEVRGPISDVHICHCGQCRRQSGHCVASAGCRRGDFVLLSSQTLAWYQSSSFARRGFCRACGSVLLWDENGGDMGINVGSLDIPTGLKTTAHIFVADKADYYEITDDLPQFEAGEPVPGKDGT